MRNIVFVFVMLASLNIGCGFGKQAQIESYVQSEKVNLPKTMFDDLRVVDIQGEDSEIVYFCDGSRMDVSTDDSEAIERLKTRMQKKANKFVEKNREDLARIINAQIKMTFVMQDSDESELFRFTVRPWEVAS